MPLTGALGWTEAKLLLALLQMQGSDSCVRAHVSIPAGRVLGSRWAGCSVGFY